MKRKKWSEAEEETLLTKYSSLLTSGTLPKMKTREKKFKPIADHVNSTHHLQDPLTFPFKWSWRDVSIKVQNMRHQYLGVKQKIRSPNGDFIWQDGEHYWENFLKYKEVFGDVPLEDNNGNDSFDDAGFGLFDEEFGIYSDDEEGTSLGKRVVEREDGKREREFEEERMRRRLRMEEMREEEEMEWREKMVVMQMDHDKQMMQMQADACNNQMQIIGVMARLVCQFFGSGNDGLGSLPSQVLQGDNGKPDVGLPSEFL